MVLILTVVLLYQVTEWMEQPVRKLFREAELVVFLLLAKKLLFGGNVRVVSNNYSKS